MKSIPQQQLHAAMDGINAQLHLALFCWFDAGVGMLMTAGSPAAQQMRAQFDSMTEALCSQIMGACASMLQARDDWMRSAIDLCDCPAGQSEMAYDRHASACRTVIESRKAVAEATRLKGMRGGPQADDPK